MDINIVREVLMVIALLTFGGIVWWAYGPSRRAQFERAAASILEDDDRDAATRAGIRNDQREG
jgi:cytochrome c oxidase cbb3-type subunit 4